MIQLEVNKSLDLEHHNKIMSKSLERSERLKLENLVKKYKFNQEEIYELLNACENDKETVLNKLINKTAASELKFQENYKKSVNDFYEARKFDLIEEQKNLYRKDTKKMNTIIRRKTQQIMFFQKEKEKRRLKLEKITKIKDEKSEKIRAVFILY